ncbi:hypothetical protein [Phenylobacterium sp.]|uniref:hypothetical protein n=1 Tax=Phenylobacterium sp. TaxID=1871053 RepID=UPI002F934CEE
MRRPLFAAACLLALSACDRPKPRPTVPPPPQAAPPPGQAPGGSAAAAPEATPLSAGLKRLGPATGFYLDQVGEAVDPVNKPPAVTSSAAPLTIIGFAFDQARRAPAGGVDVVLDGTPRPATYGQPRPDVAAYFKAPALTNVGFNVSLPPGALPAGPHRIALRVIAADGAGYYETPEIAFTVR